MLVWGIVILMALVVISVRIPRARRWSQIAMEPLTPFWGGLQKLGEGIGHDLRDAFGEFTVDDGVRWLVGLFMVWLAYILLQHPDSGTSEYIIQRGWSLNWLIIALAACGVTLLARKWDARVFFLLTFPLLMYSAHTFLFSLTTGLTPVSYGFQMMVWALLMLHSLRLTNAALNI